jgi:hypothetical protein
VHRRERRLHQCVGSTKKQPTGLITQQENHEKNWMDDAAFTSNEQNTWHKQMTQTLERHIARRNEKGELRNQTCSKCWAQACISADVEPHSKPRPSIVREKWTSEPRMWALSSNMSRPVYSPTWNKTPTKNDGLINRCLWIDGKTRSSNSVQTEYQSRVLALNVWRQSSQRCDAADKIAKWAPTIHEKSPSDDE